LDTGQKTRKSKQRVNTTMKKTKTNPNTTHTYPHTSPTPSLPHPSLSPNGQMTHQLFFFFFFLLPFYLFISLAPHPAIRSLPLYYFIILYHYIMLHFTLSIPSHTSHAYPHTTQFAVTNLNHVRQNGIHHSVPSLEDHSH
jgi:hypothetical protein